MMTPVLAALVTAAAINAPAPDVDNKPVRVLLAAGAPTREYQFVRTLFVRETDRKRADLSIFLQGTRREGVVQDVVPECLLKEFPSLLRPLDPEEKKPGEKRLNLFSYDVIIAFDFDWAQLTPEQLALLETWVEKHGGGLVLLGGPVHTLDLSRPANRAKLKPILNLCPVVLRDPRVQEGMRQTSEPSRLHFRGATAEMGFLRLDEARRDPLAGWDDFFIGPEPKDGAKPRLQRGFYTFYPVDKPNPAATVIATFSDQTGQLADGKEQPYLVAQVYGKGRTVWLGSGEMWRLRQFKETYHERFWTELARYAGSLPAP